MAKFRKKPVVIEAVQFTQEMREAHHFDGGALPEGVVCTGSSIHPDRREIYRDRFIIHTLEGDHEVSVGDWIITGIKGERYPCKPDIFEATYEAVDAIQFLAAIPEHIVTKGQIAIADLVVELRYARSGSEARRLIQAGAVRLDDERLTDPMARRSADSLVGARIRIGKDFQRKLIRPFDEVAR